MEENQVPPAPPTIPLQEETAPPTLPTKKPPVLIIAGAVVIVALILVGIVFALSGSQQTNEQQVSNTTNPSPVITSTQTGQTTPTPPPTDAILSYTSEKIPDLAFPSYTIKYPADWILSEKQNDFSQEITLTRDGGYSIRIWQGPTGGNACIFEGELPEGPANDYRQADFVEVLTSAGTMRRVGGGTNYSFCQESTTDEGFYFLPTSVGSIDYTLPANPNSNILAEMDEIISSITAN